MTNNDFRPVLWIALVVLAIANGATSVAGLTVISAALGVLTLAVVVGLVLQYRSHRRA